MPIVLHNGFTGNKLNPLTLAGLTALKYQGYSVMKTPHIGNQHPSNLLCAALGFHMDMVTFTSGERDKNFHPHLHIKNGVGVQLYQSHIYTPFAITETGQSAEDFHQSAVKKVFPQTVFTTDMELISDSPKLAEAVMRTATASISHLWYRYVSNQGMVSKKESPTRWEIIAADVFRVSNAGSGWVVPNKLNILYTLVWQTLSTGRDVVYSLSGPDMIHYIGGLQANLSTMYDALRQDYGNLPEILTVYVVPVAQCRFVSHRAQSDRVDSVLDMIAWYERQDVLQKKSARLVIECAGREYSEFIQSIAEANFLSQYDLAVAHDLYVPSWLLETPLGRIQSFVSSMIKGAEGAVAIK